MRTKYILMLPLLLTVTGIKIQQQKQFTGTNFKKVGTGRPVHFRAFSGSTPHIDTLGVSVILSPGFAVVREEYLLHNASDKSVVVEAVVPGAGTFNTAMLDSVTYGLPERFRVALNGKSQSITTDTSKKAQSFCRWTFSLPAGYSRMDLHYLVNTHNAGLHKGHDVEHSDGFAYRFDLLNQPSDTSVKAGMIIIFDQMARRHDIEGMLPAGQWLRKGYQFLYLPRDKPADVVVRYGKTSIYHKQDRFSMSSVLNRSTWLYDQVDTLNVWSVNPNHFHEVSNDNFKPAPVAAYSIYGLVAVGILGVVAVVALLGPMVWGQIKRQ